MMTPLKRQLVLAGTVALLMQACAQEPSVYPHYENSPADHWILNRDLSDEFEGTQLNESKWFVQGTGGIYHNWKGRAPSQFAPHNVRIENGKMKLQSQWEPDYAFADEEFGGYPYENITTAGVISRKRFLYGFMEIKSKAAKAAMTSSFWTLGYQSELDIFEQMGRPALPGKMGFTNSFMFSIHDWRPGVVAGKNKIFTHTHKLGYGVADGFHIYGCEWGGDYLKMYEDGHLIYSTTQAELGDAWLLTNPLELWLDSETFPWFGLPNADELPVDFEIEYVRVWQHPEQNLLDRAFFGFEGPIVVKEGTRREDENKNQKTWYIPDGSAPVFSITGEKYSSGRKSLRFKCDGPLPKEDVVAFAPNGSVKLPAGTYVFSMKVWIAQNSTVTKIQPILDDPWLQITPLDLSHVEPGTWVTLSQPFVRKEASNTGDRLRLVIDRQQAGDKGGDLYVDELSITPLNE